MTLLARILVGLVAAFFLVWGMRFFFTPDAIAMEFAIAPSGAPGLSTVRGDLGGLFVAVGVFATMGLRRGSYRSLYTAATIIAAIAFGRILGFVFDGIPIGSLVPFAAELLFIAVLLFGARQLRTEVAR